MVDRWPLWLVIAACAMTTQIVKLLAYSAARRRFFPAALGQSYGLPSLPTAVLCCTVVLLVMRTGWSSGETGFALVFAVIVIHDTVKLRSAASQQREVVFKLVEILPGAGRFELHVADYLDPRTHHPVHVATGAVLGSLFALAFGMGSG